MNDFIKMLTGLDAAIVVIFLLIVRNFIQRINKTEERVTKSLTKEEFNEIIDLKLANIQTKLEQLEKNLNQIVKEITNTT